MTAYCGIVELRTGIDLSCLVNLTVQDRLSAKNLLEKLGIYEIFPTSCVGAQSEHNNGGFNAIFTQYSAISTCNNSVKIEAASVPSVTTCLDFGANEKVLVGSILQVCGPGNIQCQQKENGQHQEEQEQQHQS